MRCIAPSPPLQEIDKSGFRPIVPKLQGRQGNLPETPNPELNITAKAVVMTDCAWQIPWKLSSRSHLQSHAGSDCSNSTGMATRDIRAQTMTRKEKGKNKPMNQVKTGNTLEIFGDAKQAKAE